MERVLQLRLYNYRHELAAIRQTKFFMLSYELLLMIAAFLPALTQFDALHRQMSYFANNKFLGHQYLEYEKRWLDYPRFFFNKKKIPCVKISKHNLPPQFHSSINMPKIIERFEFLTKPLQVAIILFLVDERAYNTRDIERIPILSTKIHPDFVNFATYYYQQKYDRARFLLKDLT
jgi:hypothetical protein